MTETRPPWPFGPGYVGQINWSGTKADATRIKAAKEMVAGQDHELPPLPMPKGAMGQGGALYGHTQRGAVGRRKMKERQA